MNLRGYIIHSTSTDADDYFKMADVLITEHNDEGAIGFIINRKHARRFNELSEFTSSKSLVLFEGGPVENESLYFIHQRPHVITAGLHITGSLYTGGDFKKAVDAVNTAVISESDLMLFIGYCGWDAGELEEEIRNAEWTVDNTSLIDLRSKI